MSGICGWTNNNIADANGDETLARMIAELQINKNHTTAKAYHASALLGAVGSSTQIAALTLDNISIALQGRVRWQSSEWERMAAQHGLPHSIVEAYRTEGTEFLRKLSGPFVLALVDAQQNRTVLAIDRLGINSLFFSLRQSQLIFASNARCVQLHPHAESGLDTQALFDYLYFHMVPSPRCIFADQEKLLPGQYLVFENQTITKGFYWAPNYHELKSPDIDQLAKEFQIQLKQSVARAAADSKSGAFLSGGTDSSTVVGMFREVAGQPVDTYSIGFQAEGFDETEYARIAARHFDARPHEYYLTPADVVSAIPLIARAYDEPFGNASAVPAYYCAKMARADGLDRLLAGDGGDELFAGNARYAKQKIFEGYSILPHWLRSKLIEPLAFGFPNGEKLKPIAKLKSYIQQAKIPLPERLETYNLLNRIRLSDIFDPAFLQGVDIREPLALQEEAYHRADAESALNRMLFMELKFTLADNDLRKVNRMCELAQIDVAYPLFDDELAAFSAQIPTDLKLKGFQLRYFFKYALKDFLPREILAKSKHGFGLPFGVWMDEYAPLREIANDSLSAFAKRGLVKADFIYNLQHLHRENPGYYGVMIWVLMMLEQWLQTTRL